MTRLSAIRKLARAGALCAAVPLWSAALPFKVPAQVEEYLGTPDPDRVPWEWREKKPKKVRGAAARARAVYSPMFILRLTSGEIAGSNVLEAITQGNAWNRREMASPVFHPASKLVLVGTSERNFHGVSVKTGEVSWTRKLGGRVSSRPVVDGEHVLFGSDDGKVHALRGATGYEDWAFQADSEVTSPVALYGDHVYVHTALDSVACLDRRTGKTVWQARHPLPVGISLIGESAPAAGMVLGGSAGNREMVFVGHADGTVSAMEAEDGHVAWNVAVGRGDDFIDVDADIAYDGGLVYAAGFHGGVHALDPASGATAWTRQDVENVNRMTLTASYIVVGGPRHVSLLDRADGRTRWTFKFPNGGASPPVVYRGRVLVNVDRAGLYVLDATTGRPLQYYGGPPGFTGAPAAFRDTVFVLSNGGWLHALSDRFSGGMAGQRNPW